MKVVIAPKPTGQDSIQSLKKWFDDFEKDISDTRSIWKELTPDIKKAINFEFSEANPNKWDPITEKYKVTKIRQGFPSTIGVRTGSLRSAASENADVVYKPLGIEWSIKENITSGQFGSLKNITVGDYAKYFHGSPGNRPIFVYTKKWLSEIGKKAVKEYIKEASGDAGRTV